MTPENWAGLIVSIITIAAAFSAVIRWLVKHYLTELRPNGGESIKDYVNIMKSELTEIRVSMARLEGKFEQHIDNK
jgi:hypothetical protein